MGYKDFFLIHRIFCILFIILSIKLLVKSYKYKKNSYISYNLFYILCIFIPTFLIAMIVSLFNYHTYYLQWLLWSFVDGIMLAMLNMCLTYAIKKENS